MRRPLVILLVAPIFVGGLAYAGSATRMASQPRIALAVSPPAQTAVRGGAVSFSVDVRRSPGFGAPVRLTVVGLPAGVRASWRLPDGAVTSRRATTKDGAVLRLRISTRVPLGARRVIVRATGRGRTVRRGLRLTVVRPARRGFAVRVHPARQVVRRGAAARFEVRVVRRATRARVRVRVLPMPRGERARFTRGALVVSTSRAQPAGTHRLVIAGSAWIGGRRVRRYAVVTLALVTPRRFTIRGDLATLLSPGADAPLDPVLTNPGSFPLRVRTLRVRVRADTTKPGCRGDRDYAVSQYGGRYPLTLRPGPTRLSALVGDASLWPRIAMRDLPSNQDACKGAVVRFDYSGLATR